MKNEVKKVYDELLDRFAELDCCKEDILAAFEALKQSYIDGKKVLICGNGGSAADSEHIVGELLKQFKKKRQVDESILTALDGYGADGAKMKETLEGSLAAISLTSHIALSTAFANDKEPSMTFAQQLFGLGQAGDCLICISTSGNSKNCVYAAIMGKIKGLKTICMTGESESKLSELCDISIRVPATQTYKVQEFHLPIYHALCSMLEEEFF